MKDRKMPFDTDSILKRYTGTFPLTERTVVAFRRFCREKDILGLISGGLFIMGHF